MTGQIPPRSAPNVLPEDRNCVTCLHIGKKAMDEPCVSCRRSTQDCSNWEASLMEKSDHTAEVCKVKPITAPDILSAAEKHMRDRAATYDKPEGERSMAQTVAVFNAFHGTELTEAQGWHFMQILKDVRLFTRAGYHADSAEDGVAYAGLKAEAKAKE